MRKHIFALLAAVIVTLPAGAQITGVVPNDRATISGTSTFLGPLSTAPRTYQLLIHASELTSFIGLELSAITYRLGSAASAPWPNASITFENYDIRISQGVDPMNRSLTFADNVIGPQTLVRSGSLTIPAGSFPVGTAPHPFGPAIDFASTYLYNGGHLLIELRHTGFTGTSASVDAIGATGGAGAGYGTRFSAAWTGSYTGTSGSQGNFSIIQLTAVPEPSSVVLVAVGAAGLVVACWRRRRGHPDAG
jgi:hypothetical protein